MQLMPLKQQLGAAAFWNIGVMACALVNRCHVVHNICLSKSYLVPESFLIWNFKSFFFPNNFLSLTFYNNCFLPLTK